MVGMTTTKNQFPSYSTNARRRRISTASIRSRSSSSSNNGHNKRNHPRSTSGGSHPFIRITSSSSWDDPNDSINENNNRNNRENDKNSNNEKENDPGNQNYEFDNQPISSFAVRTTTTTSSKNNRHLLLFKMFESRRNTLPHNTNNNSAAMNRKQQQQQQQQQQQLYQGLVILSPEPADRKSKASNDHHHHKSQNRREQGSKTKTTAAATTTTTTTTTLEPAPVTLLAQEATQTYLGTVTTASSASIDDFDDAVKPKVSSSSNNNNESCACKNNTTLLPQLQHHDDDQPGHHHQRRDATAEKTSKRSSLPSLPRVDSSMTLHQLEEEAVCRGISLAKQKSFSSSSNPQQLQKDYWLDLLVPGSIRVSATLICHEYKQLLAKLEQEKANLVTQRDLKRKLEQQERHEHRERLRAQEQEQQVQFHTHLVPSQLHPHALAPTERLQLYGQPRTQMVLCHECCTCFGNRGGDASSPLYSSSPSFGGGSKEPQVKMHKRNHSSKDKNNSTADTIQEVFVNDDDDDDFPLTVVKWTCEQCDFDICQRCFQRRMEQVNRREEQKRIKIVDRIPLGDDDGGGEFARETSRARKMSDKNNWSSYRWDPPSVYKKHIIFPSLQNTDPQPSQGKGFTVWCSFGDGLTRSSRIEKSNHATTLEIALQEFDSTWDNLKDAQDRAQYLYHWKNCWGFQKGSNSDKFGGTEEAGHAFQKLQKHTMPANSSSSSSMQLRCWTVGVVTDQEFASLENATLRRHKFDWYSNVEMDKEEEKQDQEKKNGQENEENRKWDAAKTFEPHILCPGADNQRLDGNNNGKGYTVWYTFGFADDQQWGNHQGNGNDVNSKDQAEEKQNEDSGDALLQREFDSTWSTPQEANARARYLFYWNNCWGLSAQELEQILAKGENMVLQSSTCQGLELWNVQIEGMDCWTVGVVADQDYPKLVPRQATTTSLKQCRPRPGDGDHRINKEHANEDDNKNNTKKDDSSVFNTVSSL
ncbi:hypothetical protein ACA910_017371 [Epithemia clementina (nom. ined.)]